MYKKKGKVGLFFFLVAMMSFCTIGLGWSGPLETFVNSQIDPETGFSNHSWLIFVIDFSMLMCSPCLESFLNFYHELSGWTKEGIIEGILVLDKLETDTAEKGLLFRIAEKKVRGFAIANNIRCPILIDSSAVFRDFADGRTALILFDRIQNHVRKYNLPLEPGQKKEILEALTHH